LHAVTHNSKDGKETAGADLLRFVQNELPTLSEAFAQSPLMQLRVSTPKGSVTLVKARARETAAPSAEALVEARRTPRFLHEYVPDGEPGRAFDTITAEVVGIFHAAPDLPAPGEQVDADRVLGYIDALKLRTPVKSGLEGRFVGQVAEDGQSVDFGETLFVVDSGPVEAVPEETLEEIEPPRI
jgi:acetyl-CoA carboxylase biotin carboxyl carrier protein